MLMDITSTLPPPIAIEMRVVPVRKIGDTLVLATDCKPAPETIERLVFILSRNVRFVVRSHDWIEEQLEAHYRSSEDSAEIPTEDRCGSSVRPSCHWYDGDKLVVSASGWNGSELWTGAREIAIDHPDREFWNWLITIDYYSKGELNDPEICRIKRIWNRYKRRTPGDRFQASHIP